MPSFILGQVTKMTETFKKLKENYEKYIASLEKEAATGDHSYHNGIFDPVTGYGEPPYTGDGLSAQMDLDEWNEAKENPLEFASWDSVDDMPSVAQVTFYDWLFMTEARSSEFEFAKQPEKVKECIVHQFCYDLIEIISNCNFYWCIEENNR